MAKNQKRNGQERALTLEDARLSVDGQLTEAAMVDAYVWSPNDCVEGEAYANNDPA